jgi:hypothetical protein
MDLASKDAGAPSLSTDANTGSINRIRDHYGDLYAFDALCKDLCNRLLLTLKKLVSKRTGTGSALMTKVPTEMRLVENCCKFIDLSPDELSCRLSVYRYWYLTSEESTLVYLDSASIEWLANWKAENNF